MAEERGQSAAAAAAAQVKVILEAAEQSAAAMRADAERDSREARDAVEGLAAGAEELERRLDELGAAVQEQIAALRKDVERVREAARAGQPAAAEGVVPAAAEDPATRVEEADDELIAEAEATAARRPSVGEGAGGPAPEGARLLALKMALDGRPRDETAAYLRENFELDDPEALLDEVYARAGG
jgi:hypothetical protein